MAIAYRPPMMAAVLVAFAVLAAANVAAKEPSVAARLRLLEDKEAIHSLLERFFEHQESGDAKAYANLFAADGELVLRLGTTKGGPAGILASLSRGSRGGSGGGSGEGPAAARRTNGMRHILSNVHIEVKGDAATATSRWTMLVASEDNRIRVGGTGRYTDKLVREKGEWKFQKRVIARDIPLDLEGANPPIE